MFCPQCGQEMPGRPTYCRGCGHRIEYPGDQDSRPVKRESRTRITLRDVRNVLTLTVVFFILLQAAAAMTANIILPDDIHYSEDGRCDVCGRFSDVELETHGSIEHEFCWVDAVVYDMSRQAMRLDLTYPTVAVQLFSLWLFLMVAVLVAEQLYGDLKGLSRDTGKLSRQVYRRGIVSVAVGLVVWLIAGCLFGLSVYHATSEVLEGPPLESLGTLQVLRICSIAFGFALCSINGYSLMGVFWVFNPGWRKLLRWSKSRSSVVGAIRMGAISFALSATLCMVSSTVLGRGYLAGSIFVMSVGIFMLVLGFWPVRDSATPLPGTS